MKTKISFLLLAANLILLAGCRQDSTELIWDNGSYASFPSIERFQGKYYVSFREGESHIFNSKGEADGKTRVLVSKDGRKWKSVAFMSKEGYDLRDPKLSVTPDGRLMVIMGGSVYKDRKLVRRIPQVSFSTDGIHFSDPEPVEFGPDITDDQEWIWRVTWHDGVGYAVTYSEYCGAHYALLQTTDGRHYDRICELDIPRTSYPNETTVRFLDDGRMALMARRDKEDCSGWWGISESPYTDWTWTPLGFRLGGPDFIVMPGGSIVAGTRSYFIPDKYKTILLKGTGKGDFEEIAVLPSGGDCSYPGFLLEGKELWTVYYSSHELKNADGSPRAGIYLAKIPLNLL